MTTTLSKQGFMALRTIDEKLASLERRLTVLEQQKGKPGSGECICPVSPEVRKIQIEKFGGWPHMRHERGYQVVFDHRCPKHGEKAQPAVWGRHKDLQLSVTWKEWESLGVDHDVVG